jgi:hypothetical protein
MAKKKAQHAPTVPLDRWRELYQAAASFQILAPWHWMDDTHIFGINNEHGVRLATVLGGMGEVFGAGFYQEALLVDFVSKKSLRKEDRAIIQDLDFQPPVRKPKLFPEFRSYKPGYVPWFIDEAEACLLLDDLRKAVLFGELLRTNLSLYDSRQETEFPFFPASVAEPPGDPPIDTPAFDLPPLLALPQPPKTAWELTAFYSPFAVNESPRPYFPKVALTVDAATGMILAFHLATINDTMGQTAAGSLIQAIQASGYRPAVIKMDSINLIRALQPLANALGAKLLQAKSLPMAEEGRRSLEALNNQF